MAAGRAVVRRATILLRRLETPLVALGTEIHRGLVHVVATCAWQLALVRGMGIGRAEIIGLVGKRGIATVATQASVSCGRRRGRIFLMTGGTGQSRRRMQQIERAAMQAARRHRRCRRGTRRVRRLVCRPGGNHHHGAKQQHGRHHQTGKPDHQQTRPPLLDEFDPLGSPVPSSTTYRAPHRH